MVTVVISHIYRVQHQLMVQLQGTIPHPKGVAMVLLHNHKEDSIHPLLNSHNLHITKVIHRVDS
jgi:hypothetical protein